MKRKFIINPHSGNGELGRSLADCVAFFSQRAGAFDYCVADSRAMAIEETRRALHEGTEQIVAVGGDGTVNAVVNGFFEDGLPIRPESSLAVGRTGTGSDYYRTVVHQSGCRDWKHLVLEHTIRPVDVGCIRCSDGSCADRYFVNMASVGLIARVVQKKQRSPAWLPKKLRYILPAVSSLMVSRPTPVRIETDNGPWKTNVLTIAIAKGVYAGGGMQFGGGVALDDGLFDVTVIGALGRVKVLRKLSKLYRGTLDEEPEITKLRTRRIVVRAARPMPVEFDGEVGGTTDVEMTVLPGAIRVCFPATMPENCKAGFVEWKTGTGSERE